MNNILILATDRVFADTQSNLSYPTFLAELNGKSVIEKIISKLEDISYSNYTFAFRSEDISAFHLDNIANILVAEPRIVSIPAQTMGSACTALFAACQFRSNESLLIVSANELLDQDLSLILHGFSERGLDAGTIVFRSVHPRYSYVKVNSEGLVIEAAQKNPISNMATAGVFWFANVGMFVESVKSLIRKNATINRQFYIAPVFNELILRHKKIGVYEIDKSEYIPLKTLQQIQQFEQGIL